MLLMYRIARLEVMNSTRQMFTTRSSVIARAGTWNRFRWPNSLIVMPALEIPYRARPASAVEDTIASTRLAQMQAVKKPETPWPTIVVIAEVEDWTSAPLARAPLTPLTPPSPSGSRMQSRSMNIAALRSARCVSRWVSLYSGANDAVTSVPYVDHARMNMYTSASLTPPHGPVNVVCTLCECQSPPM